VSTTININLGQSSGGPNLAQVLNALNLAPQSSSQYDHDSPVREERADDRADRGDKTERLIRALDGLIDRLEALLDKRSNPNHRDRDEHSQEKSRDHEHRSPTTHSNVPPELSRAVSEFLDELFDDASKRRTAKEGEDQSWESDSGIKLLLELLRGLSKSLKEQSNGEPKKSGTSEQKATPQSKQEGQSKPQNQTDATRTASPDHNSDVGKALGFVTKNLAMFDYADAAQKGTIVVAMGVGDNRSGVNGLINIKDLDTNAAIWTDMEREIGVALSQSSRQEAIDAAKTLYANKDQLTTLIGEEGKLVFSRDNQKLQAAAKLLSSDSTAATTSPDKVSQPGSNRTAHAD
jgi:hypothetical protein